MKQPSLIQIKNQGPSSAVINIEGTIGVPEQWQFEDESERVATYQKFNAALEQIKALECDTVRVNIRSTGGNLNDALLIYEALCALPAMVETHCYGYVASAATIIAQAASVSARFVSSGSLYLIHNSRVALEGTKEQALRTVEMLEKSDAQIAGIYADRSGMPLQGFLELMNTDGGEGKWLTPSEAVGFGLADAVEKINPLDKLGRKIKNFLSSFVDDSQMMTLADVENRASLPQQVDYEDVAEALNNAEILALENAALTRRLGELEGERKRALALPTTTAPCQDPAPVANYNSPQAVSANYKAYDNDLSNFS